MNLIRNSFRRLYFLKLLSHLPADSELIHGNRVSDSHQPPDFSVHGATVSAPCAVQLVRDINTLKHPEQTCSHFQYTLLKCISLKGKICILIQISSV